MGVGVDRVTKKNKKIANAETEFEQFLREIVQDPRPQRVAYLEREFADVEVLAVPVLGREGRVIPCLHLVPAELHLANVLHLGDLLVLLQLIQVELPVPLVRIRLVLVLRCVGVRAFLSGRRLGLV